MGSWVGRLTLVGVLAISATNCCKSRESKCERLTDGAGKSKSLADARKGFVTRAADETGEIAAEAPPTGMFDLVKYPSPAGALAAYVTPSPGDDQKHPAMIWLVGGFSNSIGATSWEPADPSNDQSARAFREAGLVLMFPSLRGGNDNPGKRERLLGEVDDVIAAADYAEKLDYVDKDRIYLGGHSTGGTLALLVAAETTRFRMVFAFGPIDDVSGYGAEAMPNVVGDACEVALRSPLFFVDQIRTPTFVIEGGAGNASSARALSRRVKTAPVTTIVVPGASHFSVLAASTERIAEKVAMDTGLKPNVVVTEKELESAVKMVVGP